MPCDAQSLGRPRQEDVPSAAPSISALIMALSGCCLAVALLRYIADHHRSVGAHHTCHIRVCACARVRVRVCSYGVHVIRARICQDWLQSAAISLDSANVYCSRILLHEISQLILSLPKRLISAPTPGPGAETQAQNYMPSSLNSANMKSDKSATLVRRAGPCAEWLNLHSNPKQINAHGTVSGRYLIFISGWETRNHGSLGRQALVFKASSKLSN